jgi:hypothetical protein
MKAAARVVTVLVLLLAAVVISACGSSGTSGSSSPATKDATFLVIGENTSASQITSAHAPYLVGTLKPKAAWLTNYHSFPASSSLGEYIALTSGQYTHCEANNDLPATCHQNINNVYQQLAGTGRTWREYSEGAANACDIVDHGAAFAKNIYSAHHDPAIYYTGLYGTSYDEAIEPRAACRLHDLPMGTTGPDNTSIMDAALRSGNVGDLNVIIPNDCENGHDPCGTKDPVSQFDDFVAREIPKIMASPSYGKGSSIIITWDEGADKPLDPANPLLLAVGPAVKPGTVTAGSYNHYSLLRTLENRFHLAPLAKAKPAKPLPLYR